MRKRLLRVCVNDPLPDWSAALVFSESIKAGAFHPIVGWQSVQDQVLGVGGALVGTR